MLDSRTFVGDDGKRLATEVRAWRRGGLNMGTLPENSGALESALRAVGQLQQATTTTTMQAVAAFKRKAKGGSAAAEASAEPSVSMSCTVWGTWAHSVRSSLPACSPPPGSASHFFVQS